MPPKSNKSISNNRLLNLPVEIQLAIMTQLHNIYVLKNLLDAFPNELYPIFQPYAKSVLNAIFWRPLRRVNDERGVVYRWMLRELQLEHLFASNEGEREVKKEDRIDDVECVTPPVLPVGKFQGRPVLCDGNEID